MFALRAFTISLFFSVVCLVTKAQDLQVGMQIQRGFIIPHRPAMLYLVQGHSTGLTLSFTKHTSGFKLWQEVYQKPFTGFEINYINTGNSKELGSAFGVNRIVDLSLGKHTNSLLRLRMGAGLGFLTKHFDKAENSKNIAIGSGLNVSILLSLYAHKSFEKFGLNAGLRIQHFSNGSFVTPNLGINIPTAFAAFTFKPKKEKPLSLSTLNPTVIMGEPQAAVNYSLIASFGAKRVGLPNGPLFGAWSISAMRLKRMSPKFSWDVFLDVGYNNSHPSRLADVGRKAKSFGALLQLGGGVGLYNHYGNTAIFIQQGMYIKSSLIADESRFFHKFGVEQYINQRFNVQLFLKSHFAKADYFALSCVYKL